MRALRLLVVALALTVALGGCKVTADVDVRVHENGSGLVTVRVVADAEAVKAAEEGGGTLEERVRLGDVSAAGWSVEPFARSADGSATLVLRKRFESVGEVAGIVAEISGPDGPLRDFRVARARRFFSTEFGASGSVDLGAATTGISADQALVQRLAAQGVDVSAIEARLVDELHRSFALGVSVRLPGAEARRVQVAPGARTRLAASSEVMDWERLGLVVAAGTFLCAAVVVAFVPGRRSGRRGRDRVRRGRDGVRRRRDRVFLGAGPETPPARVRPRPRGTRP